MRNITDFLKRTGEGPIRGIGDGIAHRGRGDLDGGDPVISFEEKTYHENN
jgi:hypothetical protein